MLLASKILVLSRLLHRKASVGSNATAYTEKLRIRLGKLRQKLLNAIDRRMGSLEVGDEDVIDAMCAFSLATSSSCADVLRHFHHIRLNAVSAGFQQGDGGSSNDVRSLRMWIKTMQDTQSLFPREMSNALARLKSQPLLMDDALRGVQDFDLETHESWMDEDIKNFTPYVRHDDLNISSAAQSLASWAPSALNAYIIGLGNMLASMQDFQAVLDLRKACLQLWLGGKGRLVGTSKSEGLDLLRAPFQERLSALLKTQTDKIEEVLALVRTAMQFLDDNGAKMQQLPLWDDSLIRRNVSHGAASLTKAVTSSFNGETTDITGVVKVYTAWLGDVNGVKSAIANLRSGRWELEDLDEEEEDLDDIEDIKHRVETEDPMELENIYNDCVRSSVQTLETGVAHAKDGLQGNDTLIGQATFLLRVTREFKRQVPDGLDVANAQFAYVQELHRLVAGAVATRVLREYQEQIKKAAQISIPGRLLWDGEPELPVVPSPWSFRLLKGLHTALSAVGPDVWTKSAVDQVKEQFGALLLKELDRIGSVSFPSSDGGSQSQGENGDSVVNGEANGREDETEATEKIDSARESRIQLAFDIEYLAAALLKTLSEGENPLNKYCEQLLHGLGLSEDLASRIKVASKDYWKRTSLLFALLGQK